MMSVRTLLSFQASVDEQLVQPIDLTRAVLKLRAPISRQTRKSRMGDGGMKLPRSNPHSSNWASHSLSRTSDLRSGGPGGRTRVGGSGCRFAETRRRQPFARDRCARHTTSAPWSRSHAEIRDRTRHPTCNNAVGRGVPRRVAEVCRGSARALTRDSVDSPEAPRAHARHDSDHRRRVYRCRHPHGRGDLAVEPAPVRQCRAEQVHDHSGRSVSAIAIRTIALRAAIDEPVSIGVHSRMVRCQAPSWFRGRPVRRRPCAPARVPPLPGLGDRTLSIYPRREPSTGEAHRRSGQIARRCAGCRDPAVAARLRLASPP